MKFLLLAIIALAQLADAHMRMVSPLPRGHPKNSAYAPIDYDLVAPLGGAKTFPCGGKGKGTPTASVRGGESITVQLEGSATHNGGHCQFALSCNGQSTNFVVLKSVLNDCPLTNAFDVPIPSGANGECVLSWTWINASGNRELYQNCADITVQGTGAGFSGPPLTVVNLPGFPTTPERGLAPFDAQGVPNNRYGTGATEGKTAARFVTNGGLAVAGAPVSAAFASAASPAVAASIPSTVASDGSNAQEVPAADAAPVTTMDPEITERIAHFLEVLVEELAA